MTDSAIIKKAIAEIESRTFGATRQFMEVHEIVYENGRREVARFDREKKDGTSIVYFPVIGQKFYFAVYLDTDAGISVKWVGTEPYNSVYFRASSELLRLTEFASMTVLEPTGGRNKGEKKRSETDTVWKESTIMFEPNPGPDEFGDKLAKLLDFLEQDRKGISRLVDDADGSIQAAIEFHNGNTMLGGPHIDIACIKRMSALALKLILICMQEGNLSKNLIDGSNTTLK